MHDISSTYRNAVPNRRHADVRRCGSKLVRYWLRSHWSLSSVGDGEGGAESREFGAGWVGVGSWSGSPGPANQSYSGANALSANRILPGGLIKLNQPIASQIRLSLSMFIFVCFEARACQQRSSTRQP